MNKEFQRQLRERYPELLRSSDGLAVAERGIETLDGWFGLINETLARIQVHSTAGSFKEGPPVVTQIKEKLGALRIHVRHRDDALDAILDEAERRSLVICERCGKPGELVNGSGYLRVRCAACRFADRCRLCGCGAILPLRDSRSSESRNQSRALARLRYRGRAGELVS